jgi:hypothetical protein
MTEKSRVQKIWSDVDRLLPRGPAGSEQNYIRHAVTYCLRGDYSTEERIAQARIIAARFGSEMQIQDPAA